MVYIYLSPDEQALERESDALLSSLPTDPRAPARRERQILRTNGRTVRLDALAELAEAPKLQSWRDEMRFLMSVSDVPRRIRPLLILWVEGWSQVEIAQKLAVSQQWVSSRLRHGLTKCYDARPLSFSAFCKHTIYRAPRRQLVVPSLRTCLCCGEPYSFPLGAGRFCSVACRETLARAGKR